ncbi:MAG: protein kinase [Pyrinomonadaceae bacterium]|nr:protein kinase [Pyrinomonadaceae bacterium]
MTIAIGIHLGRYTIVSKIGEGGMGEVYQAYDSTLNRTVALKILPADLVENEDRVRRFIGEAKAASALNHPNILTIYEIGREAQSSASQSKESVALHYIAMEFIEGKTLREAIYRDRIDLRTLLKYLAQVAEGLAKAHAAGIVHRDLKPDNIMITRDGYAKILDFGLAKLIEPQKGFGSDSGSSKVATAILPQHSTPGMIMGTVGYMSPEQAQGRREIDQRSDIFSFGCILYEVATGRRAFEGTDPLDSLHKIVHAPTPQIKDPKADASGDLQRIVRRCLAKEPDRRYQSIKEVAIELDELWQELRGVAEVESSIQPASGGVAPSGSSTQADVKSAHQSAIGTTQHDVARPTSSAEYVTSEIKKHKSVSLAVLGILLLAVGGLGFWYFSNRSINTTNIESIAVLPFANASADPDTEYLSDGITESLINSLSQLPRLKVMARSTMFSFKGRETDPRKVGRELGVDTVLTGRVNQRGDVLIIQADLVSVADGSQLWGEQYNRKVTDIIAVQEEIAKQISEKLRLRLTGEEQGRLTKHYTENPEAYQLYLKGRYQFYKFTESSGWRALEYFNQAIALDSNYALAHAGVADVYSEFSSQFLAPGEAMPKAKQAVTRALEIDPTLAEAYVSLGLIKWWGDWDWSGAEGEFRRAIELNPNYAQAHNIYGYFLGHQGRSDAGIAEAKKAQELDPLSLSINDDLALAFILARQYDRAIEQCRKTLEIDPNFPGAHRKLAYAFTRKGMYEEAIAELRKAGELQEHYIIKAELGYVYAVSGRKAEALKTLDELKELSKQKYVSPYYAARIYAGLGDRKQAFEWLEKGYQSRSDQILRLGTDAAFDSLRGDPRLIDLMRRVGFTQ